MAILAAHRLAKRYRNRLVVDDVSLAVRSGEIVGLLGPNGAGKTTSFYMIIGLVACDAGTVRIDHDDLGDRPMHLRPGPVSAICRRSRRSSAISRYGTT